jgi:hypothetical protein
VTLATADRAVARRVLDGRGVPRPVLDDAAMHRLIDLALATPATGPPRASMLRPP